MTELGTMLLSRVRIALRVGLPALQRRLPDPWDVHPDSRHASKGANLAVLFYEIFLNQTAQGLQLTTTDALGRYFVLGIPSRHRRTEETAFMVFRIFTAHPTGENPFGWNRVAAGKTTVHANIVRSQTVEASNLETMVSDRIEAHLDKGVVALALRYRRGVPERVASEGRVRFAAESEHVRVYRADELVDVVKSVSAAIDRLEGFGLRVTLPELTDIFDGSKQVVNLTVQPWFLRRVYAPSAGEGCT
jgi:hypothetical protein